MQGIICELLVFEECWILHSYEECPFQEASRRSIVVL